MKYETPKATDIEINNLIEQIQADCYLISQDKSRYVRFEEETMDLFK